ncbi:carboxylating nicotinate-nucleotide diphosphorylase [Bacillus testis]|uniref:carboxylating nicotinate-nucleotide diphosphorylase n=1 Tax=Bacillus testis TaxID=1622072 RepID=UPI00067EDEF3|nr:carboxylating nicotinate-nucleotide diphosphorylase [Bacillus testis]
MNSLKLNEMLKAFFIEDIGERDATSSALFSGTERGSFTLISKENGIFCGADIIAAGFSLLDPEANVTLHAKDGDAIARGAIIAVIEAKTTALLMAERVVLNLVQRMSGIATQSRQAAAIFEGTKTKVCDTRKTTPGLRMLEKYAARCGGASNHRYGLYDGIMIKDNHIDFMGGISKAVAQAKTAAGHMVKVEVETTNKQQVEEAVLAGVDIIMFDNCTPGEIKELVKLVPDTIVTEASGGITLDCLDEYRDCGVDYISLGCLTHSVQALDISAKVNYMEVSR